jgi:hypothetical protein
MGNGLTRPKIGLHKNLQLWTRHGRLKENRQYGIDNRVIHPGREQTGFQETFPFE